MAWEEEFEKRLGDAIRAIIPIGAQTVIATWPVPRDQALPRLASIVAALERHGIPRGRQLLLIADLGWPEGRPFPPTRSVQREEYGDHGWPGASESEMTALRARALREALGVAVVAHDAARSPCFFMDSGRTIAFNDELREAEAIVMAGPYRSGGATVTILETASGFLSAESRPFLVNPVRRWIMLEALGPDVIVIWSEDGAIVSTFGAGRTVRDG